MFDKVILAEVSQSPNIKAIQGTIADCLDLQFWEESESGRAVKLLHTLKKEVKGQTKILIILDNLWEEIKLEKIGIPKGKDGEGIKLLLTARSEDGFTKGIRCEGFARGRRLESF